MLRFVLRRAVGWLAMVVLATNVTFFLASAFLDPRSNYHELGRQRTDAQISVALRPFGLDPEQSVLARWWFWVKGVVLHFDWGRSPTGVSVNSEVAYRMPISAQLVLTATALSVVLGVALGVYTASRQYGVADRVAQVFSVVLYNVPPVVGALALVYVAVHVNQAAGHTVLHVAGASTPGIAGTWHRFTDRLGHLLLPVTSLTLLNYAGWHVTQRALLLDTLNADFVRTARATGLTRTQAIRRHALRASLIPTVTNVAFTVPVALTGAIITETVFGWQGMGSYFTQTVADNDVHGTVAVAAFGAALTAVGAVLADVVSALLDPRIRVG